MIPSGDPFRGIISHRGEARVLIRLNVSWLVEVDDDDDDDDDEVTKWKYLQNNFREFETFFAIQYTDPTLQ